MPAKKAPDNALVVRTFSYPTTAGGYSPDSTGTRPLAGVGIRLTGREAVPPADKEPLRSGANGEVRFENLDEGDYKIEVELPPGFEAPTHYFIDGGPARKLKDDNITLTEGGEVVVEIGLKPTKGTVSGRVVVNTPDGKAIEQEPKPKIEIKARNRRILSGSTEYPIELKTAAGKDPQNFKGNDYSVDIDRPGLIEIIAPASVEVDRRTYKPEPTS